MTTGLRAGIFVTFAWMLSGCAGHSHAPQGSVPATWTNTPSFSDFDYARPDRYLTLQPSLGDRVSIERAAAEVRGSAAGRDALDAATAWFDVRVRHDPNHPYVWRSFERSSPMATGCGVRTARSQSGLYCGRWAFRPSGSSRWRLAGSGSSGPEMSPAIEATSFSRCTFVRNGSSSIPSR